jgi:tRNA 2-thiouridine synthesizing protein A
MTDTSATVLDCEGLLCPLPVLKSRKKLRDMAAGARLVIRSTDPMSVIDIPHMCQQDGHRLLAQATEGAVHIFTVERG